MRELIIGERLTLRRPVLADAPSMARHLSDYEIAKMTGSIAHPFTQLCAEFRIMRMQASWRRGLAYSYAIEEKSDGQLAGIMDIFTNGACEREIGYWIARPLWGRGYATQAARMILAEAFSTLDVDRIHAGFFTDNPASGRILEKLGFEPSGQPAPFFSAARGAKHPSCEMTLKRSQFRAH